MMPSNLKFITVGQGDIDFLLNTIKVYNIPSNFSILEWELPRFDSKNSDKIEDFWKRMTRSNRTTSDYWMKNKKVLLRSSRPIYVEALGGGPLGKYLGEMVSRRDRSHGLFIHAYGHRNINPCSCCEQQYRRSYVNSTGKDKRAHMLWPFPECVSLPGYKGGVCSNCAFQMYTGCSYQDDNLPRFAVDWRATDTNSEDGIPDKVGGYLLKPRKFSPKTTPRGSQWTMDKEVMEEVRKEQFALAGVSSPKRKV